MLEKIVLPTFTIADLYIVGNVVIYCLEFKMTKKIEDARLEMSETMSMVRISQKTLYQKRKLIVTKQVKMASFCIDALGCYQ